MTLSDDVIAFLQSVAPAPFCPLTPEAAVRFTEKLRKVVPLAEEMGLVVLNDTDDSDHYCLMTRGPGVGAVAFLAHDDGASLAFPSLGALHEAMAHASAEGMEIWDVEPGVPSPHADQPSLRDHLGRVLRDGHHDAANVVALLLPLLDPDDLETLTLAAQHRDFLIRETASHFMAAVRRASHRPLLEALAGDRYRQVANPARAALGSPHEA